MGLGSGGRAAGCASAGAGKDHPSKLLPVRSNRSATGDLGPGLSEDGIESCEGVISEALACCSC